MRPYRTTYRWDALREEWRDARLFPQEVKPHSAALSPLNEGMWLQNLTTHPVFVDSPKTYKAACKRYGTVPIG